MAFHTSAARYLAEAPRVILDCMPATPAPNSGLPNTVPVKRVLPWFRPEVVHEALFAMSAVLERAELPYECEALHTAIGTTFRQYLRDAEVRAFVVCGVHQRKLDPNSYFLSTALWNYVKRNKDTVYAVPTSFLYADTYEKYYRAAESMVAWFP